MAIINSVRTGDWFNPSTWSSNSVPTSSDDVILNHPVRANSNITVGSIINLTTGGGELIISTNLRITCTGSGIVGDKVLLISPKTINSPLIQNVGSIITGTLLLDAYPNAAAAYSLRLLQLGYTSNCIRVRRSSDNTEQNIGFNLNGGLDTAALLSFVGVGNGFVTTWYDQSGNNRNATQTTAANQPRIVSSGVVELSGGLPALLWTNGQGQRLINSLLSISQPLTSFVVTKLSAASGINASIIYDSFQTTAHVLFNSGNSEAPNDRLLYITSASVNISASTTNMELITSLANGASSVFRKNGVQVATGNVGTNVLTGLSIGNLRGNPSPFAAGYDYSGHISELIFYPSNQTSNFAGIESNIQTYYGI
jgi:hypothetical protein